MHSALGRASGTAGRSRREGNLRGSMPELLAPYTRPCTRLINARSPSPVFPRPPWHGRGQGSSPLSSLSKIARSVGLRMPILGDFYVPAGVRSMRKGKRRSRASARRYVGANAAASLVSSRR